MAFENGDLRTNFGNFVPFGEKHPLGQNCPKADATNKTARFSQFIDIRQYIYDQKIRTSLIPFNKSFE